MNVAAALIDALRRCGVGDDDPVGIACSGGADSVALLHLATQVHKGRVVALHVDHGLRDTSADDATFVSSVASTLGIACDVRRVSVEPAGSLEAAARTARYEALTSMARAHRLAHVLTAHTRDDQAETVLLRLMRGDSLDAIAPVRGLFVRPLLDVDRADVRAWLVDNGSVWREDPTNTDTAYERNWVRHVLLPQLAQRRSGIVGVLARTADDVRNDERVLAGLARATLEQAAIDDVGIYVGDFGAIPHAVAVRVVRDAMRRLGADPTRHEVAAVMRGEHRRCDGVDIWRIGSGRAFIKAPMAVPATVRVTGPMRSKAWGIEILKLPAKAGLVVRSRRPGDRVATAAGTRKVQDVLVDAKVPRALRALAPILADDHGAIAVLRSCSRPAPGSGTVVEVVPFEQTWSQEMAWV